MLQVSIDKIIPVSAARQNISSLIDKLPQDKAYVLTKGGKPVAILCDLDFLETSENVRPRVTISVNNKGISIPVEDVEMIEGGKEEEADIAPTEAPVVEQIGSGSDSGQDSGPARHSLSEAVAGGQAGMTKEEVSLGVSGEGQPQPEVSEFIPTELEEETPTEVLESIQPTQPTTPTEVPESIAATEAPEPEPMPSFVPPQAPIIGEETTASQPQEEKKEEPGPIKEMPI